MTVPFCYSKRGKEYETAKAYCRWWKAKASGL